MSLQILDPQSQQTLSRLKQDIESPSYRTFLLKNSGQAVIDNLSAKILEASLGAGDARELANRSIVQMDFIRQSSGQAEQQYLGITPFSVMVEDESELEAIQLDGWLQLSADTFRWASKLLLPLLASGESLQLYSRYVRPAYAKPNIFRFSLKNIGTDTLQNMVLTRQGTDILSLDGDTYSNTINLGDIAPSVVKTVYLKSYAIDPAVLGPARIEIWQGTTRLSTLSVDALGVGRFYSTVEEVRKFLTTINVDIVSEDEEIRDLISKATNRIEEDTRRRFYIASVTERYDDPGIGKLVLRNWPLIEVTAIRFYDQSNKLVKELKPTETDWSERVIVDTENGFLELPITRQPIFLATDIVRWRTGAPAERAEWPRSADVRRMTSIVTWIEADYTYGYQTIPQLVREACTKLVVMVLLGKKGASESQGTSTITIAGLGETWGQGAGVYGGPFGALIGQLNADVEKAITLLRRRRALAISIL